LLIASIAAAAFTRPSAPAFPVSAPTDDSSTLPAPHLPSTPISPAAISRWSLKGSRWRENRWAQNHVLVTGLGASERKVSVSRGR
jgi:hypothetical protein